MFRKISIILGLFIPTLFFAQDFDSEIREIFQNFDSARAVSLSVKVQAYDKKAGKLLYSTSCVLERKDKNQYTKLDNLEYLNSNGYQVQVDHDRKYLFVSKSKKTKPEDLDIDMKSLKKLLQQDGGKESNVSKKKIKLVEEKNGLKTYLITGVEQLDEVKVTVDIKSKKLKQVAYLYSKESGVTTPYVVLDYTKFNLGESNFSFDPKEYFTVANGKYTPATKYKTYKLITE